MTAPDGPLDLRTVEARLYSYKDEPTEYVLPVFAQDLRALLAALRETRAALTGVKNFLEDEARKDVRAIVQKELAKRAAAALASVRDE